MSGNPPETPGSPSLSILFLVRALHTGGAERQLVLLAQAMHARGIDVAVAVYEDRGGFHSELVRSGVPVHVLGVRGRWDLLGLLFGLRGLLQSERPQVLHGYMSHSNLVLSLLKPLLRRARIVCGVRSSNLDPVSPRVARMGEWLHRRLLRRADLVICNSQAGRQELVEHGLAATRCIHIPNGIDTDHFRHDSDVRSMLRRQWNLPSDAQVIGLVGRLHPLKNHATLLQAVAQLAGRWPGLRVACVGEGDEDYRNQLQRLSETLDIADRVLWLGRRDDMAAVYSALDVLCLPSAAEGFPNVIGEAMSCGLPCVVSNVGDAAAVVGPHGRVVRPGDVQALAQALEAALTGLPEWNPALPRARIIEQFGVGRLVDATLAALKPLTGNDRCAA